ncbi:MAG: hypothetical protein NTX07_06960 [Solirubrobacterales bacterium]|nr:hypothetical protein [Solirubrobacterales bacterium]
MSDELEPSEQANIQPPADPPPPNPQDLINPAAEAQTAATPEVSAQAQPAPDSRRHGLRQSLGIHNADEKAMEARYAEWAEYATRPDADLSQVPGYLAAASAAANLKPKRADEIRVQAMRAFLAPLLEDNAITEEEDDWSNRVMGALGVDSDWLSTNMLPETVEVMTARANTGRLEPRDEHELIAKGGEEVYLEVVASLTKEVTVKEFKAGYAGVSYKISKNMRVNTGGTRGRMVPVGTEIQVEDVGIMSITNQRVVFMGSKKTQEFLYTKLVGINMFEEGLTLGVSNRQASSSFQVDHPQLVAATVNSAASRSQGS